MKLIGKILLSCIAFVVGTIMSGMVTAPLHLPSPEAPVGTTPEGLLKALLLSSPLLIAGIAPIASGLGGKFVKRFAAIFLILYITIGVNTIIEAAIFSTMFKGGITLMCLHYIMPCVFAAATLVWCFGSKEAATGFPQFSATGWAWRIAVAWLAFPIIYWTFGMCVAPFVMKYYNAGVAGLKIPPISVIVETQLLRSPLFLLASLPLVALWARSRRSLFISLGIAHAVLVGIYGLAQATWFPTVLRVAHSIEITFDSFAYAAVLVWLFTKRGTTASVEPESAKATAAAN